MPFSERMMLQKFSSTKREIGALYGHLHGHHHRVQVPQETHSLAERGSSLLLVGF